MYLVIYHRILRSQTQSLTLSQLTSPRQQPSLAPRGSADRNSGWCRTGRRGSRRNRLNIRAFHSFDWRAHCSPARCDSVLRCSFVYVLHCAKGNGTPPPGQCAGKFFFRGTGLLMAVRKKRPLVARDFLDGKWCARTTPWSRGKPLVVLRHGGDGVRQGA